MTWIIGHHRPQYKHPKCANTYHNNANKKENIAERTDIGKSYKIIFIDDATSKFWAKFLSHLKYLLDF